MIPNVKTVLRLPADTLILSSGELDRRMNEGFPRMAGFRYRRSSSSRDTATTRGITSTRGATTTFPHLPFSDDYFDFVYSGSVFTHISDPADSWFLELKRILRPGGRRYITVHDEESILSKSATARKYRSSKVSIVKTVFSVVRYTVQNLIT